MSELACCPRNGTTRVLFGIPIEALTMDQVLDHLEASIAARQRVLLGVVNAAKIVNMGRNPELDHAVRSADLILADGMSVVWAAKLLGRPLPERVAGIDLMYRLLERGQAKGHRVYCLGATEEVSRIVAERIASDYPGVVLAGRHHGYFDGDGEEAVARDIQAARADILFVAMTSPKKERFLARWHELIDVPICHGVGGSFDVMAGKVRRAPALWQRWGMEWLYRVVQEPGRMWRRYLVSNCLFMGMFVRELLSPKPSPVGELTAAPRSRA